jgi:hypothetical protein
VLLLDGAAVFPAVVDAGGSAAAASVEAGGSAAAEDDPKLPSKTDCTDGTWTPTLLHAKAAYAYAFVASAAEQPVLMQLMALMMKALLVQRQTKSVAEQVVALTELTIQTA